MFIWKRVWNLVLSGVLDVKHVRKRVGKHSEEDDVVGMMSGDCVDVCESGCSAHAQPKSSLSNSVH